MTADREFVSNTGTRHRMERRLEFFGWSYCGLTVDLGNPVVQQPVKDCKRCYPKGAK